MNLSIGASEIATVLGVDPWKSPQQLYDDRVSGVVFEGNEHTKRGQHLEAGLCSWYLDLAQAESVAARYGTLDKRGQLRIIHANGWARATPDLVVHAAPVNGGPKDLMVVDTKCPTSASRRVAGGGWVKTWDESAQLAPLNYRVQVMWQIHLARLHGIPVVGGELAAGPIFGKLHRIFVAPDDEWFLMAMRMATEFRECLQERRPLPPHFTQQEAEHV